MKKIFFLILLVQNIIALAQDNSYKPVKQLEQFKKNFAASSASLQSIESDFVQTKNLSVLKNKISSKGKFFYKKENKVRIEYSNPYYYLMVINQNQMMVKDGNKTTNFNTKSNKLMQSINTIMLDCMRGTVSNNKDFSMQVYENNNEYLLQMTPITNSMKRLFIVLKSIWIKTITMYFD
ncbi:MAG: outer membrane lipoprotein carrier protein LolA [Chitinophagaceae bacterium]